MPSQFMTRLHCLFAFLHPHHFDLLPAEIRILRLSGRPSVSRRLCVVWPFHRFCFLSNAQKHKRPLHALALELAVRPQRPLRYSNNTSERDLLRGG